MDALNSQYLTGPALILAKKLSNFSYISINSIKSTYTRNERPDNFAHKTFRTTQFHSIKKVVKVYNYNLEHCMTNGSSS